MASLHIDIVTPQQSAYSGEATDVSIISWEGEMGILPGHDIHLNRIRAGLTTLVGPDGKQAFQTGDGLVEVQGDRVTLLVQSCEAVEG